MRVEAFRVPCVTGKAVPSRPADAMQGKLRLERMWVSPSLRHISQLLSNVQRTFISLCYQSEHLCLDLDKEPFKTFLAQGRVETGSKAV